jgi:hypothetical protein
MSCARWRIYTGLPVEAPVGEGGQSPTATSKAKTFSSRLMGR